MQNEYNVTWERYRGWTLERMFTGKKLLIRMVWFLMCGWSFGMTVVNQFDLLPLLLTCLCVYFGFFRELRKAKKKYRSMESEHGPEWLRRIELEERKICITDGTSSRVYFYSDIVNALERKDHFCLEMKERKFVRLYKDGFVECTADECWEYIEHKMDEAAS